MNHNLLFVPRHCSVWIFCRVIDNFGDAGVAWRLAKILSEEAGCAVHLWIDNLATAAALHPSVRPDQAVQEINGVVIHLWADECPNDLSLAPPACVIEMFGCELPPAVRTMIRRHRVLWLNWEYLSAEDWAENLHLMPSPQADGSEKLFYFMGFSEKSGGLLREAEVMTRAENTGSHPAGEPDMLRFYLFGYASPVWNAWLHTWQRLGVSAEVHVAGSAVAGTLPDKVWHDNTFHPVRLRRAPFVAQSEFDALLQSADILVVRGEDSFVRAQYAGKPFFWHIYPQQEAAHVVKLHAFWDKVYPYFPPALAAAHRALSDELNGAGVLSADERRAHWQILLAGRTAWAEACTRWRTFLLAQPSALEKLILLMAQKRLK